MKIRTKLTIIFTIITASILLSYALIIYFAAKESREKEFFSLLKKESITKANLFLNAKVDSKILQDIYRNNRQTLNEVEVAIYDSSFKLLYHDAYDIDFVKETPEMIKQIYQKGELRFYQDDWQVIGLRYSYENKSYIITAAAYDQYGYNKLKSIRDNSILIFLISVVFIYIAGYYFSKKTFTPIKEITQKAREISATNLYLRVENNNNKDELSELASTFNDMLERLKNSFEAQNQFVSNIAHELRTPLTSIITELELSLLKDRNNDEYKKIIKSTYSDSKKLVRLINNLLDFAKASYDSAVINFKPIRIDEILLDARLQVQKIDNDYKIDIHFENDFEQDSDILVNGNEYFLRVAFVNLFENGCKYSKDKYSKVNVITKKGSIELNFVDNGVGIPKEDLEKIFEPFYRGKNKNYADGSGIGLSLVAKIIALHKGSISVSSIESKGSTFTVVLPNISSL